MAFQCSGSRRARPAGVDAQRVGSRPGALGVSSRLKTMFAGSPERVSKGAQRPSSSKRMTPDRKLPAQTTDRPAGPSGSPSVYHRPRGKAGAGRHSASRRPSVGGHAVVRGHPERRAGAVPVPGIVSASAADGEVGQRGAVVRTGRRVAGGPPSMPSRRRSPPRVPIQRAGRPASGPSASGRGPDVGSRAGPSPRRRRSSAAARETAGGPGPEGALAILY